jgi:hypothetical protein
LSFAAGRDVPSRHGDSRDPDFRRRRGAPGQFMLAGGGGYLH